MQISRPGKGHFRLIRVRLSADFDHVEPFNRVVVGWAKRSVPTAAEPGGHGAKSAPLPALRVQEPMARSRSTLSISFIFIPYAVAILCVVATPCAVATWALAQPAAPE